LAIKLIAVEICVSIEFKFLQCLYFKMHGDAFSIFKTGTTDHFVPCLSFNVGSNVLTENQDWAAKSAKLKKSKLVVRTIAIGLLLKSLPSATKCVQYMETV